MKKDNLKDRLDNVTPTGFDKEELWRKIQRQQEKSAQQPEMGKSYLIHVSIFLLSILVLSIFGLLRAVWHHSVAPADNTVQTTNSSRTNTVNNAKSPDKAFSGLISHNTNQMKYLANSSNHYNRADSKRSIIATRNNGHNTRKRPSLNKGNKEKMYKGNDYMKESFKLAPLTHKIASFNHREDNIIPKVAIGSNKTPPILPSEIHKQRITMPKGRTNNITETPPNNTPLQLTHSTNQKRLLSILPLPTSTTRSLPREIIPDSDHPLQKIPYIKWIQHHHQNAFKNVLYLKLDIGYDKTSFGDNEFGTFRKGVESQLESKSIGLMFKHRFSTRFSLCSDLTYTMNQTGLQWTDRSSNWVHSMRNDLIHKIKKTNYNYYNEYYRLDFTAGVSYSALLPDQWELSLSLNLGYNINSRQNGDLLNQDFTLTSLKKSDAYQNHNPFFGQGSLRLERMIFRDCIMGFGISTQTPRILAKGAQITHKIWPVYASIMLGKSI